MAVFLASADFLIADEGGICTVCADKRLEEPVRAIVAEYQRRTDTKVDLRILPVSELDTLLKQNKIGGDVVLRLAEEPGNSAPGSLPDAMKVAWKYPTGEPVWAAALGKHPEATAIRRFFGSATAHRLWSESQAGFTITSGKTHAEAFDWVVKNRVSHTYAATADRMLGESGGIREGICIDVGCGTGILAVELAKRSDLTIHGLDIDPDMRPIFEKNVRAAGLQDRIRFVEGDAQAMPFPDNHADVIFSRGTLVFIPDIAKCLREVQRVLKPTGVAFLGGRYLYTPQMHKISTEKLREIVRASGVSDAEVIDARGQWVKIVGPQAPQTARQVASGPHRLAHRFVADYSIADGSCLLICPNDGGLEQGLQQGFLGNTDLKITALYASEKTVVAARERIRESGLQERMTCTVGRVHALPFDADSFDVVAGVGPMLLFSDRKKAIREIHRVLRPGGVALVGGKFLHMPEFRRVSSETLRADALATGISSIRVLDDMGQWVEIRKAR